MEALLEENAPAEELKKFEKAYYEEMNRGGASNQTRFNYAWCLIRSRCRPDIHRGIMLLEDLCSTGDSEARRDYLFYLAIANTKISEYQRANDCVKKFLAVEPNNRQAKDLEKIIKDRLTKEGLKGLAIAGGAAIALGGLVGLGMALASKK
jgi:fission 1 protein